MYDTEKKGTEERTLPFQRSSLSYQTDILITTPPFPPQLMNCYFSLIALFRFVLRLAALGSFWRFGPSRDPWTALSPFAVEVTDPKQPWAIRIRTTIGAIIRPRKRGWEWSQQLQAAFRSWLVRSTYRCFFVDYLDGSTGLPGWLVYSRSLKRLPGTPPTT